MKIHVIIDGKNGSRMRHDQPSLIRIDSERVEIRVREYDFREATYVYDLASIRSMTVQEGV